MNPNIPWHKYLLSFFVPQQIEFRSSKFNPYLKLLCSHGRLKLNTKNAVYSFEDLYEVYAKAFAILKINQYELKNALLLGYGLGSIPIILKKNHHIELNYTAVEIDTEIAEISRKYYPELHQKINLHIADAMDFVKNEHPQYDLIAVDIFIDDLVPDKFSSDKFLICLNKLLHKNSMLLFNTMVDTKEKLKTVSEFYSNIFCRHFTNAEYLKIHKNWMLCVRP